MELKCKVQNYAWGKLGSSSAVAKLVKAATPSFEVSEEQPYAELWMGTHPNGPSVIKDGEELLSSYIESHPECLGDKVTERFGAQLPFLFKVLSVNTALSIQAHPNKEHAERLHAARPDVYKDPNHKPEMTVALTPFTALCGFREAHRLVAALAEVHELRALVGEGPALAFTAQPTAANLKLCFRNLMTASKEEVAGRVAQLSQRMQESSTPLERSSLFLTLSSQYPGDVGCFSVFLLNVMELSPGQAMFLGPNVPHAYLKGDCVECMACSDNVVRAGLTPKYQDVDTLIDMLDYGMSAPEDRLFKPKWSDGVCSLFDPPVPDFAVESLVIPPGAPHPLRPLASASILLVVEGGAVASLPTTEGGAEASPAPPAQVGAGTVLFLPAHTALCLAPTAPLTAFRACVE